MYEELITLISKEVSGELSEKCANSLVSCLGVVNRHAKHSINTFFYPSIYKLGIYSPIQELALASGQQLVIEANQTVSAVKQTTEQFALFREHLIKTGVITQLGEAIPRLLSDYLPKNIPEERIDELSAILRRVGIWKYQLLALLSIPFFEKDTILKDLKQGVELFDRFDNVQNLAMVYLEQLKHAITSTDFILPHVIERWKGMDLFQGPTAWGISSSNPGFLDTLGRIIQGIGGGFLVAGDIAAATVLTVELQGASTYAAVGSIGAGLGLIGYACRK